jgi:hypothetical protein
MPEAPRRHTVPRLPPKERVDHLTEEVGTMRHMLGLLTLVGALGALSLSPGAGADPTHHFTESFTILCGGHAIVIISKPGSSNAVTFDGRSSTSVSVLFGLHVTDADGNVVVDFRKPGNPPVQTCTDTSWPAGFTATAETLITPAH